LVSVTDTQLKSTSNGGLVASSTGADILFTKSDGTTLLDYEIESYASTTGQLIAWVNIPILSAVTDTTIYEYFGNASAPAETPGNITGTWDTNYKAVWHMNDNAANTTVVDSTGAHNGTNIANTSGKTITGQISSGLNYTNNTDYTSASFDGTAISNTTMESWFNLTNTTGQPAGIFTWADPNGCSFGTPFLLANIDSTPNIKYYVDANYRQTTAISTGTWYHAAITLSGGTTWKFYLNGALQSTYTGATSGQSCAKTVYAARGYNNPANVKMDEYRVSDSTRSADWIKTEYNNQSSPSTFYAYGALGANGRQSSTGAAVPAVRVRGGVKFH
jgi:hypothetical protein